LSVIPSIDRKVKKGSFLKCTVKCQRWLGGKLTKKKKKERKEKRKEKKRKERKKERKGKREESAIK